MKLSLKWVSEYVDVPGDVKAFCDRLDLTGTGVEGVDILGDNFQNVVTGRIASKERHPNSDHMWVCMVDVGDYNVDDSGSPTPLQIVCGAQNFNAGDKVACALIGAVLPGGVKIKKSRLRGVNSYGMNCSERELGLGQDHEGIMILPPDTPVGIPLAEYLGERDTVLDLEITPNRPDSLSIVGLAREIAAMYGCDFRDPTDGMASKLEVDPTAPVFAPVKVTIDDAVRCPRYTARVIAGCKIGPSPDWMVERLASIGQRSINNVVDVTNYILYLLGQPLHSFDLDKLREPDGSVHIVIKAAADGEEFTTLDGVARRLTSDMTVISTPTHGSVALAGVMGGLSSEITEDTTNILLEAATFESGRTSRTSRNLGLMSESSIRYERRVDDHGIELRSAAAAALITEVSGGHVVNISDTGDLVDEWPMRSTVSELKFRHGRFCSMMGADIPLDFTVDVLRRLGCSVKDGEDAETLLVTPPTYRPDLEREIDLYEEVLRLWGMDRVADTTPRSEKRIGVRSRDEIIRKKISDTLRAMGMSETLTYSFADELDSERMHLCSAGEPDNAKVEIINPINTAQGQMRQSLVPGLLRSIAHNLAHSVKNIQLFEIGTVFHAVEGKKQPREKTKVAGVLCGAAQDEAWNTNPAPYDFYDGKGILEQLIRELAVPKARFRAVDADACGPLQPGRAAHLYIGGSDVGWLGQIHPAIASDFDISEPVIAFEVDFEQLAGNSRERRPYVEVPTYPAIEIDQNIVVKNEITDETLMQSLRSSGGKYLESVRLIDVYQDDDRVGPGKKSMTYRLCYRASEGTLTFPEVEAARDRMLKKVCASLGAEIRS